MPIVWTQFDTREETERAIGRLGFVGYARDEIDRIERADGRWMVGVYVDDPDAPRVQAIMSDPDAPTGTDVLNAALIFGAAMLAGLVVGYLLPRDLRG